MEEVMVEDLRERLDAVLAEIDRRILDTSFDFSWETFGRMLDEACTALGLSLSSVHEAELELEIFTCNRKMDTYTVHISYPALIFDEAGQCYELRTCHAEVFFDYKYEFFGVMRQYSYETYRKRK